MTSATRSSSAPSSWRSSRATSTSSSRSASPACASRSRPAPSRAHPTGAARRSSSMPGGSASSSSSRSTRRSSGELRAELAAAGIEIVDYQAVPEHHHVLRQRFLDEIYPVLTPLAVDPGHPFPYISTLSLSIAVGLRDPDTGERVFARVKVPQILPRLLEVRAEPLHPDRPGHRGQPRRPVPGHGGRGGTPLPGHAQRGLHGRGGRGGRPAHGDRGGAAPPALRRGGPARGRADDAGLDAQRAHARPRPRAGRRVRGRGRPRPDRAVRDRRPRPAGPQGRAVDTGRAAAPRAARR